MDVKSQKIDGDSDYPRQHAMILFSSCAEKNDIDAVDIILRIMQLHRPARSALNKHGESPIEQLLSSDKNGCLLIVQSIPAISSHQLVSTYWATVQLGKRHSSKLCVQRLGDCNDALGHRDVDDISERTVGFRVRELEIGQRHF